MVSAFWSYPADLRLHMMEGIHMLRPVVPERDLLYVLVFRSPDGPGSSGNSELALSERRVSSMTGWAEVEAIVQHHLIKQSVECSRRVTKKSQVLIEGLST